MGKSNLQYCMILIAFGLILMTGGCNLQATPAPLDPELVDQSFITDQPCKAPCWYGLKLDQSSESEVLKKLNELPFVDPTKIQISKNESYLDYSNITKIDFNCVVPKGKRCGSIFTADGVVKYIGLSIQYPLSLKSVVDKLGPPDYFTRDFMTPHGQGCMVSFNWTQKKISLGSEDPDSERVCQGLEITAANDPDLQITDVAYGSMVIDPSNVCTIYPSECTPWAGFLNK